jgi:hypothetical protein
LVLAAAQNGDRNWINCLRAAEGGILMLSSCFGTIDSHEACGIS